MYVTDRWTKEIQTIEYLNRVQRQAELCTVRFTDGTFVVRADRGEIPEIPYQ
jgi:hypothetical protein